MQQEKALKVLKSGANVFLTGSAGTGKTYVLNKYIEYLKIRKIPVAVTASTGIAATHMNGMTIHSWSGIGVKDELSRRNLLNMRTKKHLIKNFKKVKVLIIDEVSMLHKNQLGMVDQVLKEFKESDLPFGGIQIVLSGDFFQLPPIGRNAERSREKFCFMSPSWVEANLNICYLSTQFRQTDLSLNAILNQIRSCKVSPQSIALLQKAKSTSLAEELQPTRLFTHNVDVERINEEELEKLDGKARYFFGEYKGNPAMADGLKNSVLAPEKLGLKVGAKVMFVKNNPEKGYINGSLGEVIRFTSEGKPKIKLLGGQTITAEKEEWSIEDDHGQSLARYQQLPLRLAWAITVHKSQGMTLEAAQIDLSKTFEAGQGYVALSRLKKLENLVLEGFNEMALQMDPLAVKADQRFMELSQQAETIEEEILDEKAEEFIRSCGGLTETSEIEKRKEKIRQGGKLSRPKEKKLSTYEVSLGYFEKKLPLEEIAKERNITEETVINHLVKLKKDNPKSDFSFYRPSEKIVRQVQKAKDKLAAENAVGLKAIYEELGGKIEYKEIKLALML